MKINRLVPHASYVIVSANPKWLANPNERRRYDINQFIEIAVVLSNLSFQMRSEQCVHEFYGSRKNGLTDELLVGIELMKIC